MKTIMRYMAMGALLLAAGSAHAAKQAMPSATFIQLHRGVIGKPVPAWAKDFKEMKALGMDTILLQWSAQDGIAYFSTEIERYEEQYDTVGRILDAAEEAGLSVYLGLHHDSNYWQQITARERVIKDYFYVRTAQNIAAQKELLKQFGDREAWVGYYIPDEIDDINWRKPSREELMRRYLKQITEHLRKNDAERKILVSSFYRLRTAPEVFAQNLQSLVSEADLDGVMVQDGLGDGIPWKYAERYVPVYYAALADAWKGSDVALWGIVETFTRASGPNEPFVAVPSTGERVNTQIDMAAKAFAHLVYFTYLDYAHPDVSDEAKALHEALKKRAK